MLDVEVDEAEVIVLEGARRPRGLGRRRQAPEAEIVRANLCRGQIGLVYVIVALRGDGRFVQVMIDAPSGKIVWSR